MAGYPIELELRGKLVVVVGLGRVGCRKAAGLLAAEAHVLGIDPAPRGEVPSGVVVRAEPYHATHLEGACLVLASATPKVNRAVVVDGHRAGVWVCSASEPGTGDFSVPAVWRDGPLLLTVSTSGASPALAAMLRDRAASALGPAASGMALILAELRPIVLERLADPEVRNRLLADWADPRWLELWRSEGPESVRRRLLDMLPPGVI